MNKKDRKANIQMNEATNQANIQMNEATNQANRDINAANIDYSREAWRNEVAYNWEMWNRENAYNSASAQRQRLEDAGLNPYMMMDGGDAGTASSSSAPSHNQPQQIPMQAGHVEPYYRPLSTSAQDIATSIQGIGVAMDNHLKMKQAQAMDIDNQYRAQRAQAEIANMVANSRYIGAKEKGQIIQNTVDGLSQNAKVMAANMQPKLLQASMNKIESEIGVNQTQMAINRQIANWYPKLSQQQIDESNKRMEHYTADITLKFQQGKLTEAQAAAAYQDAYLKHRTTLNMPQLTFAQTRKLAELTVQRAEAEVGMLDIQSGLYGLDKETREAVPAWLREGGALDVGLGYAERVARGAAGFYLGGKLGYFGKGLGKMLNPPRRPIGFQ